MIVRNKILTATLIIGCGNFFLACILVPSAAAQTVTIQGFITDTSDGRSLEGANITLQKISGDTFHGAAADGNGFYRMRFINPGRYAFRVSYLGYTAHEDTLTVGDELSVTLSIALRPDGEQLEDVVITVRGGLARQSVGRQRVRPVDLARVPTPAGSGDLVSYLEYPADVNWIRVTEIRNSLYRDQKDTLDAVVTLQHLESGQTEVMQDSLIRFEEGIYAYNFRTFMEIDPEQSYKLKAERSDGQFSSVTVTLPGTFPTPSVQISVDHTMYFFIENVENLADVRVTLNDAEGRPWEFPHRHDAVKVDDNSWRVIINLRPQLNAFFGQ